MVMMGLGVTFALIDDALPGDVHQGANIHSQTKKDGDQKQKEAFSDTAAWLIAM